MYLGFLLQSGGVFTNFESKPCCWDILKIGFTNSYIQNLKKKILIPLIYFKALKEKYKCMAKQNFKVKKRCVFSTGPGKVRGEGGAKLPLYTPLCPPIFNLYLSDKNNIFIEESKTMPHTRIQLWSGWIFLYVVVVQILEREDRAKNHCCGLRCIGKRNCRITVCYSHRLSIRLSSFLLVDREIWEIAKLLSERKLIILSMQLLELFSGLG